jgi:ankyrin repeat protein
VVQLLLEKGADVNARTDNGETALQCAATYAHEITVKLLLEKGADFNARTKYGETALHKAAANGNKAVIRLLLEKGVDVAAGQGAYIFGIMKRQRCTGQLQMDARWRGGCCS